MNRIFRIGRQKRRRGDSGVSLAEMLISLFLVSTTLVMIANYIGLSFTTTKSNKEKDFATQKAIQLVNELRAYVESGGETPAEMLDNFDDGTVYQSILTTQGGVTDPEDALSKNIRDSAGNWRYLRNIRVTAMPNENPRDLRIINIKICRAVDGQPTKILADVTTVIRTFITDYFPPSQVFDVYCIALENVPDWWVHMSALRPMVESSFIDLQSRNPGLEFRMHWISRMGYGRDQLYTPFLNLAGGPSVAVNWTVHYPGLIRVSDNFLYYDPDQFNSRLNVDGTIQNPDSYALADQFNHAVRYPRELDIRAGRPEDTEVSYRELIEKLNSNPEQYVNAIIINLHGELLPIPPIRNFSDAAKDPEVDGSFSVDSLYDGGNRQGLRVVTHTEQLQYQNNEDVTLRVYAYQAKTHVDPAPSAQGFATADNVNLMNDMIVIRIPGVVLNDTQWSTWGTNADFTITPIIGGWMESNPAFNMVPSAGNDFDYQALDMATIIDGAGSWPVLDEYREWNTTWWGPQHFYAPLTSYSVHVVPDNGGTPEDESASIICLYNTPLGCPDSLNSSGLDISERLYGHDYIPCPVHLDFAQDLTDTSNDVPKNTARWIITLKERVLPDDEMLTIETRITDTGANVTNWNQLDAASKEVNQTGTVNNHPYNLSETYTWIGNANLPVTERYQIIGDPRHSPYIDVKLSHGYNWYWIADGTMAGYTGFDRATFGYGGNSYVEVDYPRACNLVRSGLLRSGNLYTSMTGYNNYYIGLGGEAGADDANGFEDGIPVNGQPYQGYVGSYHRNDKNDGTRTLEEAANSGDAKWFGLTWLGETFPDTEYLTNSNYQLNGNLSSSRYYQVRWDHLSHSSFSFCNQARTRKTGTLGPGSFYNSVGDSSGPFSHAFNQGAKGSLEPDGEEMASIFHFPLPSEFPAARPFNLDAPPNPDEWNFPEYTNTHNTNQLLAEYYTNATGKYSSALIHMQSSTNPEMNLTTDDSCFIVANGLDRGVYSGEGYFTRFVFMSLIYGVLRTGVPGTEGRMHQIPRVEITEPSAADGLENPTTVDVIYDTSWFRWDDRKYLDSYPGDFSETDDLIYALKYSPDDGLTWHYIQDRLLTQAGERPDASHECSSDTTESWNLSNPTNYPEGNYLLRLEAFREDIPSHYSYHQRRVLIERF